MPTVEFYGFADVDQSALVATLRDEYGALVFREDIVFVVDAQPARRVERWQGGDAPFVRIASRSEERLKRLVELTVAHCDVETMIIGFHERNP